MELTSTREREFVKSERKRGGPLAFVPSQVLVDLVSGLDAQESTGMSAGVSARSDERSSRTSERRWKDRIMEI